MLILKGEQAVSVPDVPMPVFPMYRRIVPDVPKVAFLMYRCRPQTRESYPPIPEAAPRVDFKHFRGLCSIFCYASVVDRPLILKAKPVNRDIGNASEGGQRVPNAPLEAGRPSPSGYREHLAAGPA